MRKACALAVLLVLSTSSHAQDAVKQVVIPAEVPFSNPDVIDGAIVKECGLPQQVGQRLQTALGKAGIEAKAMATPKPGAGEHVLLLEIAQAHSGGNAFMGHKKSITVSGKLYKKGQQVA